MDIARGGGRHEPHGINRLSGQAEVRIRENDFP